MTIEEMKKHEWTVSWSGGKDSTATIILMHELRIPIKEIIYVRMMWDKNIPATLPIMTEFVDKTAEKLIEWGYKVRIVPSIKTAKELCERVYTRSSKEGYNGSCYGISSFCRGFCGMTSVKIKTIEQIKSSDYEMIGIAADETERLKRLTDTKQSIMATLGIKEEEVFDICRKYNMLSPLYELGIKREMVVGFVQTPVRERENTFGKKTQS